MYIVGTAAATAHTQAFIESLLEDARHKPRDSAVVNDNVPAEAAVPNADGPPKSAGKCSSSIAAVLAAGGGALEPAAAPVSSSESSISTNGAGIVTLSVGRSLVGKVLGHGGCTMRDLRASSGAEIDLIKDLGGVRPPPPARSARAAPLFATFTQIEPSPPTRPHAQRPRALQGSLSALN